MALRHLKHDSVWGYGKQWRVLIPMAFCAVVARIGDVWCEDDEWEERCNSVVTLFWRHSNET